MKRITFFVLLFVTELMSYTQNLVVNPGFEIWENTIKPSGWTTVQNCLKDSVSLTGGKYSCRHSGGTGTTKYLGQTLAVEPGRQYNFSFFYRTEITGTGNGCRIWCYWKDTGGNSISDPSTDAVLRPSKYLNSVTWQQFSIITTAPPAAASFYLEVRTYTNSLAYWDDIVFQENGVTYNPEEKLPDIKIYPNPASDYLIICNIHNLRHIDIQNVNGKCVWTSGFSGETTVTIPVYELPDGLYVIRISTSEMCITRKFIKKRN